MDEDDIPSFNTQLRTLKKGHSIARVERYERDDPTAEPTAALARMRSVINAAVSRARKAVAGSNFRVESVATLTADNTAILCVVSITRQ